MDTPAPRITSLTEYSRGWRAARALWAAGFHPEDHLPADVGSDAEDFALGWRRFCRKLSKIKRQHGKR